MADFTLILPVHNRPDLAVSQLNSYREQLRVEAADDGHVASFPIVIANSSAIPIRTEGYLYPEARFPKTATVFEKIHDTIGLVTTPYVVIGADDDVFDIAGLRAAARWLRINPDYATCSGQSVTVTPRGEIAPYKQLEIDAATPYERLRDHLADYSTTWYSMQRTENARDIYATVLATDVDTKHLGEILPSCLSVIAGKAHVMDRFYMVRRVWPGRKQSTELSTSAQVFAASRVLEDKVSQPAHFMLRSKLDRKPRRLTWLLKLNHWRANRRATERWGSSVNDLIQKGGE